MVMQDQEIQKRAVRLAQGETRLSEFRDWFIPMAWSADESNTESQQLDMIRTIDLLIAEHLRGDRSQENFREELLSIVNPVVQYRIIDGKSPRESSTSLTGLFRSEAFVS